MYNSLKRQPDYKRRICWAEIVPTSLTTTRKQDAVVEYIGPYLDNISIHGNAKSANSVRTTPTVMTNIKDKIKVQQPREVYTTLTLDGSNCALRDLKQVQNAKYQQKKETKPTNQKSANNSDDLQHLLSILGDHSYMQEVIQFKGKPPCIIAYTSDQLQDLKKFCSTDAMHTSVIEVDRTFNLDAVYVTITVFHNSNLIRKT